MFLASMMAYVQIYVHILKQLNNYYEASEVRRVSKAQTHPKLSFSQADLSPVNISHKEN